MVSAKVVVAVLVVLLSASAIVVAERELIFGPGEGTVTVDTQGYGYVSGAGTYKRGTEVTLNAVGTGGQTFYKWSDGETTSVRTFTVQGDTKLTAFFAKFYKVSVSNPEPDRGRIAGSGSYKDGDSATLTATPNYGYLFSAWTENGSVISTTSMMKTAVGSDRNISAVFEKMKFSLSISSNYFGAGTPAGAGSHYYLDRIHLDGSPKRGYAFEGWYDGVSMLSGEANFIYTVVGNKAITARYGIIHDASFTLPNRPMAGSEFSCTPLYNVEIASRQWVTQDANLGAQLPPAYSRQGYDGSYIPLFSNPAKVRITCNVEYTDGQRAEYSTVTIVDKTYTKNFTWDYTYGYVQNHNLLWGLIKWTTNETAKKTMTMDCSVTFSEYTRYREALKPVNGWRRGDMASFVTYGDPMIVSLASTFSSVTANLTSLERAQFVLNFVSCAITYVTDQESTGYVEYFKYPYETIYDKVGDCEDTAFLYAAIMRAMGYSVVVFGLPGHAMAGVSVPGANGYSMDYGGQRYYFCETTGEPGYMWGIGQLSSSYRKAVVTTYPVP
ncbi:MAG: hypothetical protein KA502_01400 [Candidatus Methanomethylophilaceae archaeon]|nr:hypothetical protein [Candidatus Methanomethylophilaceae archaeon]